MRVGNKIPQIVFMINLSPIALHLIQRSIRNTLGIPRVFVGIDAKYFLEELGIIGCRGIPVDIQPVEHSRILARYFKSINFRTSYLAITEEEGGLKGVPRGCEYRSYISKSSEMSIEVKNNRIEEEA